MVYAKSLFSLPLNLVSREKEFIVNRVCHNVDIPLCLIFTE
jgi:hypothetical protein